MAPWAPGCPLEDPVDNDDLPVGRIWPRREVLALLGAAGAAVVVTACGGEGGEATPATGTEARSPEADATPSPAGTGTATAEATAATATTALNCVVTPELTEGPYFVDEMLERSDIRPDPGTGEVAEGAELRLAVNVYEVDGSACIPIAGAIVDVWHCDALGVYSDVSDPGFNTSGQKFLRGFQRTDEGGHVEFTTIYPGWYQGRAVHIHFKVRGTTAAGRGYDFTSQWFFDEATTDLVHAEQPYAAKGYRTLLNENDNIFRQSGGQTLLAASEAGNGWAATFNIGIQL